MMLETFLFQLATVSSCAKSGAGERLENMAADRSRAWRCEVLFGAIGDE